MGSFSPGWRLTFQTKVLIPVLVFLILLPVFTLWTVNRQMTEQVFNEARQRLNTAEGVFQNSLDFRAGHLLSRYRNVVNEPRFKAVANLADSQTMTVHLNELLSEIGGDAEVMLFTVREGDMLAGAKRTLTMDLAGFAQAAEASIRQAARGQPSVTTVVFRGDVFSAVSMPVLVNEILVGALTVGERLGDRTAQELKLLTRTEILLFAGGSVAASTLQERSLHERLLEHFFVSSDETDPVAKEPSARIILNGEHFLTSAGLIGGPGEDNINFLLLSSYERQLRTFQDTRNALLWFSGCGILLSAGVIWFLIRRITQPLRELTAHAEAVGGGDFSRRLERFANDECGDLADSFNRMTQNLRTSRSELETTVERLHVAQTQLVQSEKLSAVGQFVAGVTHELNNPLTSVIGFAELLQRADLKEEHKKYVTHLAKSTERCHKIVQSLLTFSRQQAPERKQVEINPLIEGVLEIVAYDFRTNNVEVRQNLAGELPTVQADPHQLQQIFLNILTNARQAMEAVQRERIIEIATSIEGQWIRIVFHDNGPGIPKENLSRIFDPFFTTKEIGKGTGLGLSLSYGIIQEHGGHIRVESPPGKGTRFEIELPAEVDPQPGGEVKTSASVEPRLQPSGAGRRVLVIDDEGSILELVRAILESDGYTVETTTDGEAVLQDLRYSKYDLIVCDWKMPGINGIDLFKTAVASDPSVARRFVFMTGDVIAESFKEFLRERKLPCLPKPFSLHEFHFILADLQDKQESNPPPSSTPA